MLASPPMPARSAFPYCYVLDDEYRVVMAGPAERQDPLAAYYDAEAPAELLPEAFDSVVRSLTEPWQRGASPETQGIAMGEFHVSVSPLHGDSGRRIAVFVQRV